MHFFCEVVYSRLIPGDKRLKSPGNGVGYKRVGFRLYFARIRLGTSTTYKPTYKRP